MPVTYEPIATTTLSSAGQFSFTSIPSTYTDLRIVLVGTVNSDFDEPIMRFNNDTGTNYSVTSLYGTGGSAPSQQETSVSRILLELSGGMYATNPSLITIDIFSYAGSNYKTVLSTGSEDNSVTGGYVTRSVGLWRSSSAINRIDFLTTGSTPNFRTNTTATIYGIKAA